MAELSLSLQMMGLILFSTLKHVKNDVKEITYGVPGGLAKKAMDSQKGEQGKTHAFLGSVTGLGSAAIGQLKSVDLGIAECISLFFSLV